MIVQILHINDKSTLGESTTDESANIRTNTSVPDSKVTAISVAIQTSLSVLVLIKYIIKINVGKSLLNYETQAV